MNWLFLLPLTTCLTSGYLYKKSADEMAYLTAIVAAISLVLTLILAPWQIQIAILGLTIFSTKKLLLKNENKILSQDSLDIETPNSPSENTTIIEETKGMYRGAPWKSSQIKIPLQQQNTNIKYRGARIMPGEKRQ